MMLEVCGNHVTNPTLTRLRAAIPRNPAADRRQQNLFADVKTPCGNKSKQMNPAAGRVHDAS
jgi:hypothetical protein